jgi:hypothetical protein
MINDHFDQRDELVLEPTMRIFLQKILIGFVTFVKNEGCDKNSVRVITITGKMYYI